MPFTSKEKRILGLTVSSHMLVHWFEGVLPPLIPLMVVTFGTDYFQLGLIVSIFSYAFGLGSLPAGFLADRAGPGRLIAFFLFGAGALGVGVFAIPSLWPYGAIMGCIGLFCSVYHPASNTLIAHEIREKGKGFGIHGIAGSLGVAGAPVLSAWLGTLFGWKAPHVVFGLLALGTGLYALRVFRGVRNPGPRHRETMPTPQEEVSCSLAKLLIFFASAVSLGLTYKGIMTFLPAYMGERVHIASLKLDAVALGGTIATLALISGAIGQYVAARMVDRIQPEKLYLGTILLGTLFVFLMALGKGALLVVSSVLYALFYFATQPIQNYMLSRYLPRHRHGMGYGIHFFLTFGVGSTAAAVCGYLADNHGLPSVFFAMGICFVAASCLSSLLLLKSRGGGKEGAGSPAPGKE